MFTYISHFLEFPGITSFPENYPKMIIISRNSGNVLLRENTAALHCTVHLLQNTSQIVLCSGRAVFSFELPSSDGRDQMSQNKTFSVCKF